MSVLAIQTDDRVARVEYSDDKSPPNFIKKAGRVFAITLDNESMRLTYGDPCNNAYSEIRKVLEQHGFRWQPGSVYFGGSEINAVTCVLAAIDFAKTLPWFAASVRDIRMLRIEEFSDLMPALQEVK